MATLTINFSNVIAYSLKYCFEKSHSKCAEYVKNAFSAGGCTYIKGNGWDNQAFCRSNGFVCIGDFVPVDYNPRPHSGRLIQFPDGYVQQVGDICLIQHGTYGHICYAMGTGINDWASDYKQKYPGQADGTGPYCYSDNGYKRVQFWRHQSVLGNTPVVSETVMTALVQDTVSVTGVSSSNSDTSNTFSSQTSSNNITTSAGNVVNDEYTTVLGTHLRQD